MVWSRSGIERKRLPTVDCSVPKAAGCIPKAAGCHFWDQDWQNCCRVLRVTVFRLVRVEVIVVDVDCVVEDVILDRLVVSRCDAARARVDVDVVIGAF